MNPSHGNRRFIALVAAAVFAVLAPWGAAMGSEMSLSRKTGRILLAGGQDVLWVVRGGEGEDADKFDLIIRRPGGKWRTLSRFSGSPAAIAAGERRLHIVSGGSTPNTSIFSLSNDDDKIFLRGNGPRPGSRWPVSNPPATLCSVPPLGKSTSQGFIAVVPHESDKLSTTTTASQPARKRSGLTLLQTVEGQWEPLSEIDDVPGAVGARISAIATDNWVYNLVAAKDDSARLLAWNATDKKAIWKDVALPDKPSKPLTVSVLRNQPVLVTIAPAGWTVASPTTLPDNSIPPEAGGIRLAIHELKADKIANNPQSIEYQDKPLILPGSSIPEARSFGKASESQLVLLWRETETYRCALVDLNGEVVENKEVEELLKTAPDFNTRTIIDYFLLAIPAMLLGFILFGKRKNPTGPMILPTTFIPGSLLKRLVAVILDSVPFSILGILVTKVIRPDLTTEDIMAVLASMTEQQQDVPIELLLCMLGSSVAWVIYGSIMEGIFGATIGKMAMRLEVTSADGKKPTVRQAILRNLIRPIEMSWPVIIVAMAIPLLTRTRQRLGDIMARTVVVEKRRFPSPDDSQKAQEEPPKGF